ncbi:hypothetical protein [Nocardioides perillae]|uniref:Uncharacterized protein n=1 Tax=Nocardioides perillae TaxID=1119534 RepID=A0A7Y9RUZ5_9ACTN|nr:hypothetical protein [Nocardioides perillae]NYG54425.1 hypothetical protein [Nocardioides perillae]
MTAPVPQPRDLPGAAAWSRRRLAAALVSGAAGVGGDPPGVRRPVRLLVGGGLLSLLLPAVAVGARLVGGAG